MIRKKYLKITQILIAFFSLFAAFMPVGLNFCKCLHRHGMYFAWDFFSNKPHKPPCILFLGFIILIVMSFYFFSLLLGIFKNNKKMLVLFLLSHIITRTIFDIGNIIFNYTFFRYDTTFYWQLFITIGALVSIILLVLQFLYIRKIFYILNRNDNGVEI